MRRNDHDVTDTIRTTDLKQVAGAPGTQSLRRTLPSTLNDGVEPHPKGLVIR